MSARTERAPSLFLTINGLVPTYGNSLYLAFSTSAKLFTKRNPKMQGFKSALELICISIYSAKMQQHAQVETAKDQ